MRPGQLPRKKLGIAGFSRIVRTRFNEAGAIAPEKTGETAERLAPYLTLQ